jgi:hypothetical protein
MLWSVKAGPGIISLFTYGQRHLPTNPIANTPISLYIGVKSNDEQLDFIYAVSFANFKRLEFFFSFFFFLCFLLFFNREASCKTHTFLCLLFRYWPTTINHDWDALNALTKRGRKPGYSSACFRRADRRRAGRAYEKRQGTLSTLVWKELRSAWASTWDRSNKGVIPPSGIL